MAGRLALQPELLPRAAVEGGEPSLHRLLEGFFVHEANHQDTSGYVVLNDGGNQAIRLFEIEIHTDKKIPAVCAAGNLSYDLVKCSKDRPSRQMEPVMVMIAGVGENKHELTSIPESDLSGLTAAACEFQSSRFRLVFGFVCFAGKVREMFGLRRKTGFVR